jgi:hypothetical protein
MGDCVSILPLFFILITFQLVFLKLFWCEWLRWRRFITWRAHGFCSHWSCPINSRHLYLDGGLV